MFHTHACLYGHVSKCSAVYVHWSPNYIILRADYWLGEGWGQVMVECMQPIEQQLALATALQVS